MSNAINKDDFHVLIAGAGMAGLTLAQGLKKAGIRCSVYERDKTRNERLQGYRVNIVPEANHALRRCLPPALFDKLESLQGRGGISMVTFNHQMDQLAKISAPEPKPGEIVETRRSCSRITLRNILLEGLTEVEEGEEQEAEHNEPCAEGDDDLAKIYFNKKISHYELIPAAASPQENESSSSSSSSSPSSSLSAKSACPFHSDNDDNAARLQNSLGRKDSACAAPQRQRVVLHFADGTQSAEGDVLVGADGANSAVRAQRLPEARREATGVFAIGGKVPLSPAVRALLPPSFDTTGSFMGPRGRHLFVALHILRDSPSEIRDEELSDEEFLWANDRSYLFWALSARAENFVSDAAKADLTKLSIEELQAEALRMMEEPQWHPNIRELIKAARPGTLLAINIKTSLPVEPWETSPVTLIGDAVHSMTPFRGLGGNTALIDAQNLTNALIEAVNGEKALLDALHDYEDEMIRRGFETVAKSLKAMKVLHLEGWFSTTLRNLMLKAMSYYLYWTRSTSF